MDEQTRLKARELLLRSRVYRYSAIVFAVMGAVVFLALYFRYIEGDIIHALHNPMLVMILVLPFLPAFVLSWMAAKTANKFMVLLEKLQNSDAEKKNTTREP